MDKNLKKPLVSVVMPVYNCESFVADAIESIINQTFRDFELLIIDDCSTDKTIEIVGQYDNSQIRLIKKDHHSGLISSLNLGIKKAAGEYIARMDGDDICHHERLETQISFLEANRDVELCGTWYQLLDTHEEIRLPLDNDEIKLALLDYCAFGHPTVMFRKHFLIANNLKYDNNAIAAEDYDLWTRIIPIGKVANIPQSLVFYRSHANQVSRKRQSDQIANSDLSRIRLLCYPIHAPSELDLTIARRIVRNESLENLKKLKEILFWLDNLAILNDKAAFYKIDAFREYLEQKKQNIARRFFLNTTSYNPAVLFGVCTVPVGLNKYLTFREAVKFTIKCFLFWN